jgi:hypothetical protein
MSTLLRLGCISCIAWAAFISGSAYCEETNSTNDVAPISDDQVIPTACHRCGSTNCECEMVCCPQKVTETVKKPFWKVTCEYVCIPGFRFPWECCHDKLACKCREFLVCGSVRAVNVLEEDEYECEVCGYKWEVKCVRCNGEARNNDCQCPRCARQEVHAREQSKTSVR